MIHMYYNDVMYVKDYCFPVEGQSAVVLPYIILVVVK